MENGKSASAGKKLLEGILLSFGIMGLFMALQILVSFVGMTAAMTAYMLQTGGDIVHAQYALFDILADSDYLTMLTVVATLVSAMFSVPAYWLVWGRKRTAQDRQYFREKVLKPRPFAMVVIGSCGLYYLAILILSLIHI